MKKKLSMLLVVFMIFSLFVGCAQTNDDTRTITDANGNEVEIPGEVTKVAPVIGAFAELTQIVAGEEPVIAAAAVDNINDDFKNFLPAYNESNPEGYNSTVVEDIIASGAQVAYGPADAVLSEDQVAQLEEANIPFVEMKITTVDDLCQAATIIGDILGGESVDRAEAFTTYWKGQITEAEEATANITDKESMMILSNMEGAYTTINKDDISHSYIEAAGMTNAAADLKGQGRGLTVDKETILSLNPDWILAGDNATKEALESDPALESVTAIQEDQILISPYGAYLWHVRSGEGSMMPMWLVSEVYPEAAGDYDKIEAVKYFFTEFYNYDLSDEEAEAVFAGQDSTYAK